MFIFVKGFFIYDGTAREAGVAGTHATPARQSLALPGISKAFASRPRLDGQGITIWIEWWMERRKFVAGGWTTYEHCN
jgi:hypothetical protein